MVSQLGGSPDRHQGASSVEGTPSEIVTKVESIKDHGHEQASRERDLPVKEAKELTAGINKFLESVDTQLRFKMHEELNEYYVTIVDSKTDEVIREIPSKKLLDMHAEMRKFVGLLIDRKI